MIDSDSIICMLLPAGILTRRERNAGGRAAGGAALVGAAFVGATTFLPTVDAC